MRKYKFRAWNKRWKAMEDWSILKNKITGKDLNDDDDNLIIMQWTGIKDKNGKDIYEGDIVSISASQPGEGKYEGSGIVTFMEGSWVVDTGFEIISLWSETLIREVKSNIFEYSPREDYKTE